MNFLDAVRATADGGRIRQSSWDQGVALERVGMLLWFCGGGEYHPTIQSILSVEWEVVPRQDKRKEEK